jgi:hypothetical protein
MVKFVDGWDTVAAMETVLGMPDGASWRTLDE